MYNLKIAFTLQLYDGSPWLLYLSITYLELSSNQQNSSAYLNCKVTCLQYPDGIFQKIVIDYLFEN